MVENLGRYLLEIGGEYLIVFLEENFVRIWRVRKEGHWLSPLSPLELGTVVLSCF